MPDTKARLTIIDTDPGIDDAIGILFALASPEFAVAGITTVAGNIGLETTTRNACRLLAFADRNDIPVLSGAAAPLSRPGPEALDLHGVDGLGGITLPAATASPGHLTAVDWLAELLLKEPAGTVDVLALGPLTNIAQVFLSRPEAARRIRHVIAMGGAIHEPGNIGPRSEFNFAADPEAADVVIRSGLPLSLVPLDVTRQVRATREFAAKLQNNGSPFAGMAARLIGAYFATSITRESRPLHDPCVMLAALAPELFGWEQLGLRVDLASSDDAGAVIVDDVSGSMVKVAMQVDSGGVLDLIDKRLAVG
jgi:purine nucleosidase/pyrimidine-specific ribonucleoside hydrolase